jgi:hypothetical protein
VHIKFGRDRICLFKNASVKVSGYGRTAGVQFSEGSELSFFSTMFTTAPDPAQFLVQGVTVDLAGIRNLTREAVHSPPYRPKAARECRQLHLCSPHTLPDAVYSTWATLPSHFKNVI